LLLAGLGRQRGLLLGVWALVSLMAMVPAALQYVAEGQAVPWGRIWSEAIGWFLWIAMLPVVLWACRRFPLERGGWRRAVPVHVLTGAIVAVAYAVLVVLKNQVILSLGTQDPQPHLLALLPGFVLGGFQVFFLVYWMSVAIVHALAAYRRLRERELDQTKLEARLSRTELELLKLQLDPHFLFNALNAASALVQSNPEGAERMLELVSEFLRESLRGARRQEHRLEQEIAFLRLYLEIEQTRFGARLRVQFDIPPELGSEMVPSLILQPLVENAVRHAMPEGERGLDVTVTGRALGRDRMELRVSDNGRGLPVGKLPAGVGLANSRARLEHLHAAAQSFEIVARPEGGTTVTLALPRRSAQAERQPAVDARTLLIEEV
jgi:two-component system, LytTR family, sensor kinase